MKIFERFFMWISGAALAIVFVITFAQVVQRYVFSMSLPWATDIIRIFFIYSVFSGMCVGIIRKSHLNIDVVLQIVSPRVRIVLDLISNCIVIFFLATVMRYSISFIQSNADQTTPYILFPMSYVYAIFPITIVIMVIALLLDSVNIIAILSGKKKEGGAA